MAQCAEILPGAVAVVELLLSGLEACSEWRPAGSCWPSSAFAGEVVVGQLEKVVQHGADGVVLVAVPLVVREPQEEAATALGGAVPLPGGLLGKAGHGHLCSMQPPVFLGVAPKVSPCLPASLEFVDQAVVAAVQEKQHGVLDDARAARGALLEDVVVLQSVRPQGLLPHEDEDLHPPGVAELEGLDVVEAH